MEISGAENKRIKMILYSVQCCALHWTDNKNFDYKLFHYVLLCSVSYSLAGHFLGWNRTVFQWAPESGTRRIRS